MARVVSITYRALQNTGKYENESVEMRAELDAHDDWAVEFYTLKSRVLEACGKDDESAEAWTTAKYRRESVERATGRPYGSPPPKAVPTLPAEAIAKGPVQS